MKTKRKKYVGLYCDEGSFVNFYRIKNRKTMAFKEFESKKKAQEAYENQDILSYHDLAPKILGKVMKIDIWDDFDNRYRRSGWGYITEIAEVISEIEDLFFEDEIQDEVQDLIDSMERLCSVTFHDCHPGNYGYVKRKGQNVLVCIDTGNDSFNGKYCY